MTFNPIASPVDYVIVSGLRTPGLAEITGASSPRSWDEQRGYALAGARLRFRGVRLAHFKIVIRLLTEEHWAAWHEFAPIVQRPPVGERPAFLQVEHPILEGLDIRMCGVENVSQPVQTADGEWTIEIACIEFREPVPMLSAPAGATDAPKLTENERVLLSRTATAAVLQDQLEAMSGGE